VHAESRVQRVLPEVLVDGVIAFVDFGVHGCQGCLVCGRKEMSAVHLRFCLRGFFTS
jgi:hypothetical protein